MRVGWPSVGGSRERLPKTRYTYRARLGDKAAAAARATGTRWASRGRQGERVVERVGGGGAVGVIRSVAGSEERFEKAAVSVHES